MILNLIVVLLILLVTAFLANQGFFSALLLFITATFASILAGALFEPLQTVIMNYKPDFARGATFLLLFFFAFSICRLTADFVIPRNIKVPRAIDVGAGALLGLFASLVVMGSLLIGVEMLPFGTSLLGYDRFPSAKRMQATRDEGDALGTMAPASGIWFAPDSFTLGIWNLSLGRALGGNQAFAAIHPDLATESYGYRNTVQYGVPTSLHPDLFKATAAYTTDDPTLLKKLQIADPGKIAAVVRAEISLGSDPKISSVSANGNNYFFVTPSEVRLLTDKGRQYYPTGYLENGVNFVPMPLDVGQLADDYSKDKVIEDWVFQINDDEKPAYIEVKQLARAPLASILKEKKPVPPLAKSDYPPHAAQHERGTVTITAASPEHPLKGTKVFLLTSTCRRKDVDSAVGTAYANILTNLGDIDDASGPWAKAQGKPGVPDRNVLISAKRVGLDIKNKAPEDPVLWNDVVPLLLAGNAVPDGPRNLTVLQEYFNKTLIPLFQSPREGTAVIASGETDENGAVVLKDIPRGEFTLVAAAKADNAYYVWITQIPIAAKEDVKKELSTGTTTFSIVLAK